MHPMQKASPGQRPRRGGHQEQPAERAGPMRIAKALARAGLCSRREAERWIELGRVSVNGLVLKTPARDVSPSDRILVDGKALPGLEPPRLWRYHKPRGLVTTHSDPQGRKTVFDSLPPNIPRVISIGRLDFNTEGLLLLTNDGALARHLELPATGWLRRYRVRAHGTITQETLDGIKGGIEIAGTRFGPIEAALDKVQGSNVWLTIGLREGKNREVRTVLDKLGLTVNRLIRISFGPFQLLDLEPGTVEPVRRRTLIDQLGPKVSAELALTDDEDAPGRAKWAKPKAAAKPPAKAPSKSPGRAPTKAHTKTKTGS
jgi:23S rRNA pseudouridine2605 synthase